MNFTTVIYRKKQNVVIPALQLFLFFAFFFPFLGNAKNVEIVNLKTEYTQTALGIDEENPRFSWQMKADERGYSQSAYQITVKKENGQTVWNSGKVKSAMSLNVKYKGLPLKPSTRYNWEVSVWDHKKKKYTAESWFETGLMNSDPQLSSWSGAKWIGGNDKDLVIYPDYLPVFRINYSLRLDENSNTKKAGFVYGANDARLLDKNKNLYQLENLRDSSYISIELDISGLQSGEEARIHIYRVGYHKDDRRDVPFKTFPVSRKIIDETNRYQLHTFYISSVLGYTSIYLNEEKKENRIGEINLNPLGQGGDFIAFPVVGEIGFSVPENSIAFFSKVEIRNFRSPSNILFSEEVANQAKSSIFFDQNDNISFINSEYKVRGNQAKDFALANPGRNSMPMLRTTFTASDTSIAKARMYVTSRGIYEIYLNGKRIGEDYFNPGLTQYNKTHLYQVFDVSDYLLPGKNAIGAVLGEGWWSGGATFMGDFWNFFGDRQSLLAKLVITYSDGKEEIVVTNPNTWTYYNDGPLVYGSFFQGEVYDANKETSIKDWNKPDYDDSKWKQAIEIPLDNTISQDLSNQRHNMPMVNDYSQMRLMGQFGQTVKKIKELTAISVEEVRPGVFVYDMGQNMVGVPEITLSGMKKGEKIMLRYAEVKYPDLPEYKDHSGMIMLENIRAAMAQDIYITRGGNETIQPRFTFHGYRFLEITGMEKALPLESVKGIVLSSVHELASVYETSNPKVNKLWENITWSTYSNFLSIPTDCAQRNERLGWSGDISVFSRTATFLADVPQFLRKHLRSMRDVQREDGRFPDIAPMGGGFGGILWGSAGITVSWESFLQYNDLAMLEEHYDAMKNYVNYLLDQINPETNILGEKYRGNWGSLGDWLSLEDSKNEKTLLWESYFIYDLELMNKIAEVLNQKKDAEYFAKLHAERKAFFNKTYIDSETGKTIFYNAGTKKIIDTQVSYVLPIAFNIIDKANEEKVNDNFIATITRENKTDNGILCPPYSLMTGFIGTAWIAKALSDIGRSDIAYRLFLQTTYPSWLYSVDQGATTIWERLNSYTHTDGFGGNNRMNSFNHYSFGAIGSWMYNYSLGIERDENFPGFKHFLLKPEPDPTRQMLQAKGHYDSMYGRIESAWEWKGNNCYFRFSIPANTSAVLELKAASLNDILWEEKPIKSEKDIRYLGEIEGKHQFELKSGSYEIQVINY